MVEIYERRGGSESTMGCIERKEQNRTRIETTKGSFRPRVYLFTQTSTLLGS